MDKATKKLRSKKDEDSDVSRSSSLSRSFSRKSKKEKEEKDKKRLSGLKYSNKSKDSVNSIASSKKSVELKSRKKEEKREAPKLEEPIPVVPPSNKLTIADEEPSSQLKETADVTASSSEPEPVKAESTPKEEVALIEADVPSRYDDLSPNTPLSPTHQPLPIPLADERQPLLVPPSSSSSAIVPTDLDPYQSTYLTWNYLGTPVLSIGLIILAIIVIIFCFLYHDFNVDIQNSVHPSLNSINLIGINSEGVVVRVDCSMLINYNNVSNSIFSKGYMLAGLLVGAVQVRPKDHINITINHLESLNVTTPVLNVNLTNNAISQFEFESTVSVSDTNLIRLLNQLLSEDESEINLQASFTADIFSKFIILHDRPLSMEQNLTFSNKLDSNLSLENTSVTYNEKERRIEFNATTQYPNELAASFLQEFPEYQLMLNCEDRLVHIGDIDLSLHTDGFSISGCVSELDYPTDSCLNKLMSDLIEEEQTDLFVRASTNSSYPPWLNHIVTNVNAKVPSVPIELQPLEFDFRNVEHMNITLTNYGIIGNVIGNTGLPVELSIDMDVHSRQVLLSCSCSIDDGTLVSEFEISKLDPQLVAKFLSKGVLQLGLNASVNQLKVKVPMLRSSIEVFHAQMTRNIKLQNKLDINQLNKTVEVSSVNIAGISPEKLDLSVECFVEIQQLGITIDETVELSLIFNGTEIGVASIDRILPGEALNIGITVWKDKHNYINRFINQFLSKKRQFIDIGFLQPQLLSKSTIEGISVPEVFFMFGNTQERVDTFIVSSTIHILGSDVELEIFNPLQNQDLEVELTSVNATHEGEMIGELTKSHLMVLKPGITKTGRIPIRVTGIGGDILRKAINGSLKVNIDAKFQLSIGRENYKNPFEIGLEYQGNDMKANIRF
ncbi:hypothetical protein PSN45_000774 [Yamadazyma tenuis]|nr:hypothetical protein PSN45_000774 [Yamadazyma tenuis]